MSSPCNFTYSTEISGISVHKQKSFCFWEMIALKDFYVPKEVIALLSSSDSYYDYTDPTLCKSYIVQLVIRKVSTKFKDKGSFTYFLLCSDFFGFRLHLSFSIFDSDFSLYSITHGFELRTFEER